MATTYGSSVARSAQIAVSDITVDDILAAQSKVGAPSSARVNTSSGNYATPDGETTLAYNLVFSWTEELPAPSTPTV